MKETLFPAPSKAARLASRTPAHGKQRPKALGVIEASLFRLKDLSLMVQSYLRSKKLRPISDNHCQSIKISVDDNLFIKAFLCCESRALAQRG